MKTNLATNMTTKPDEIGPGIYYDLPADLYHAVPAISSSLLKRLYVSFPKKVKQCPFEATDAMENGTAFHSYLLDRDFHTRYFVVPEGPINPKTKKPYDASSKKYTDWLNSLASLHQGKTALDTRTMQCIEGAVNEFRDHPYGAEIAGRIASKAAKTEVSLFWTEERDGKTPMFCKARLDILDPVVLHSTENDTTWTEYQIRDPKTTRNANPRKFQWDVLPTKDGLNYWIQAAWYYRGAKKNGLDVAGCEFIAIELEPPHGLSFHGLDDAELDGAQQSVLRLANTWQDCVDSGKYGNYPAVRHQIALGEDQ